MNPYMRAAEKVVNNFMNKPWLQGWQWAVEIEADDAPIDFDLYVKDVDFGAGSIDVDTFKVGGGSIAFPTSSNASEIVLTLRDDQDMTIDKWMDMRLAKVKNKDGTINIPADYIFKIHFFTLNDDGQRKPYKNYQVFPIKKGNMNFSREGRNTLHSFPLIFQKFSTVGNKVL